MSSISRGKPLRVGFFRNRDGFAFSVLKNQPAGSSAVAVNWNEGETFLK